MVQDFSDIFQPKTQEEFEASLPKEFQPFFKFLEHHKIEVEPLWGSGDGVFRFRSLKQGKEYYDDLRIHSS